MHTGADQCWLNMIEYNNTAAQVLITGHSLGGAYAAIFTNELTWRFR